MSDTKAVNNLRDSIARELVAAGERIQKLESQLAAAVEEAGVERRERRRHQDDATRNRAEARRMSGQIEQLGAELRGGLSSCMQASEDNPGDRGLAGRVRQARAAVRIYEAITKEARHG